MIGNYLLSCFFGILAYFLAVVVAHEAIIGGRKVNHISEFPYIVSVHIHENVPICSGGIIGANFVLTAAHCVITANLTLISRLINVKAGTLMNIAHGPTLLSVDVVYFSSNYRPSYSRLNEHDFAVLKLTRSIPIGHHIRSLQLPQNNYTAERGYVAGFGWNVFNRGVGDHIEGYSDYHLRKAEAKVISTADCENAYERNISSSYLCAKILPVHSLIAGACYGDDGSPLVQYDVVIGILIKIRPFCDERRKPAIYTRIASFQAMIRTIIEQPTIMNQNIISLRA